MNGLLVVDKPGGMTSHDVVSRIRKLTGESSVGHLGTLDPMATGVLPLLLGKYTRLAQFFSMAAKSYTGTIRFGFATDTYDREGEVAGPVIEPSLSIEQIRDAASAFRGLIEQMPPAYSAKKINGKPAYKLAREGKPVELKPKTIQIHEFEVEGLVHDSITFRMTVSAGGYVRSVAHELGLALGCGGHLSSLKRTRAGDFGLDKAWGLDALEDGVDKALLHPRSILTEMPSITADELALGKIRNGGQVNLADFSESKIVKVFANQREMVAVGKRIAGTLFQPIVVMN